MDLRPATIPAPADVWRSTWHITLTWRSDCGPGRQTHLVVDDPADLARSMVRYSADPRLVSYRFARRDLLSMDASPANCFGCGEPFSLAGPRRWWRPCACGGHHVYECVACAHRQAYPEIVSTCS
ncbi:hypothetical protein O7635_13555 [Asanoa sp. WMMD1127]|uniref:hypothetical protein n=1 Tax=Asanoa sp. WMMD1127 TaxID=3016107 RepID=UPI0024166A39|nr:hypothetical protein [Asanoa sp. WMMD1127]MDG4822876.1 hypothetical protein [Asanoa sp. WMMD1127]